MYIQIEPHYSKLFGWEWHMYTMAKQEPVKLLAKSRTWFKTELECLDEIALMKMYLPLAQIEDTPTHGTTQHLD